MGYGDETRHSVRYSSSEAAVAVVVTGGYCCCTSSGSLARSKASSACVWWVWCVECKQGERGRGSVCGRGGGRSEGVPKRSERRMEEEKRARWCSAPTAGKKKKALSSSRHLQLEESREKVPPKLPEVLLLDLKTR